MMLKLRRESLEAALTQIENGAIGAQGEEKAASCLQDQPRSSDHRYQVVHAAECPALWAVA